MTETRYERSKRIEAERARHANIVHRMASGPVERFNEALEKYVPPCRKDKRRPSPWLDWASDPEDREDYETDPPTKEEAEKLCDGCNVRELCLDWAKATGQFHGVYDGQRRENGRWIDGRTRPATKSMGDQL
jgi:hypothetical protein